MTAAVGDAVLSWLNQHPYAGEPVEIGELTFRRDGGTGVVTAESDPPDTLGITVALLDGALDEYISFDDGVIALKVAPEPLRYRALYLDGPYRDMVMCERVR